MKIKEANINERPLRKKLKNEKIDKNTTESGADKGGIIKRLLSLQFQVALICINPETRSL